MGPGVEHFDARLVDTGGLEGAGYGLASFSRQVLGGRRRLGPGVGDDLHGELGVLVRNGRNRIDSSFDGGVSVHVPAKDNDKASIVPDGI
jgi:hypothetical protein